MDKLENYTNVILNYFKSDEYLNAKKPVQGLPENVRKAMSDGLKFLQKNK